MDKLKSISTSEAQPGSLHPGRSASSETEYPKCRHCGSDKGSWFSRVVPMGNFCENCGGPWTETDGVE